jgi:hypothetical protein
MLESPYVAWPLRGIIELRGAEFYYKFSISSQARSYSDFARIAQMFIPVGQISSAAALHCRFQSFIFHTDTRPPDHDLNYDLNKGAGKKSQKVGLCQKKRILIAI